jgi:hypothetical protein
VTTVITHKCDGPGCEHTKRETNHWWKMYLLDRRDDTFGGIVIVPWDVDGFDSLGRPALRLPEQADYHLCGEQCMTRKLSELLTLSK